MALYCDATAVDRQSAEMIRRVPIASVPIFAIGICLGALIKASQVRVTSGLAAFLALGSLVVLHGFTPNGWHLFAAAPLWTAVILLAIHIKAEPPVWTARLGELGFTLYLLQWPPSSTRRSSSSGLGLRSILVRPST